MLKDHEPINLQTIGELLPHRSKVAIRVRCKSLGLKIKHTRNDTWTPEELRILKEHSPIIVNALLPRLPGRTRGAIHGQCRNLGLPVRREDSWTPQEDAILRAHAPVKGDALAPLLPFRSPASIETYALKQGIPLQDVNGVEWTEDEIQALKGLAPVSIHAALRALPHRNEIQIKAICLRNQIPLDQVAANDAWTPEEEAVLRSHVPVDTRVVLPLLPGRSQNGIWAKCRNLGIQTLNKPERYWSKEDMDVLLEHAPTSTAHELLDLFPHRTPDTIRAKCAREKIPLSKVRLWGKKETALLHTLCQTESTDQIARMLKRSHLAILSKIRKEGLLLSGPVKAPRWTETEDQILREGALGGLDSIQIAAQLPGRTFRGVKARSHKLGVHVVPHSPNGQHWTRNERVYLRTHYGKQSMKKIAAHLGRSPHAIYAQAQHLKVSRRGGEKRTWTDPEDGFIRQNVGRLTPEEMGVKLKRTTNAIKGRIVKLNLSRRSERLNWSSFTALVREDGITLTRDDYPAWAERGFKARGGKTHLIYPAALRTFLKKRPEAMDVYALSEDTAFELGINLEKWPEPPSFKIITCTGPPSKIHPPIANCFDLYERNPRCTQCGKHLGRWAHTYSAEWIEAP